MSRWQTVSTPDDGAVTKYGAEIDVDFIDSIDLEWISDGACKIPTHKIYVVAVSDTSNMGHIIQPFQKRQWAVGLHEDSLWTFDIFPGPSYEWKEDKLAELPDWVKVGGNWGWMDD